MFIKLFKFKIGAKIKHLGKWIYLGDSFSNYYHLQTYLKLDQEIKIEINNHLLENNIKEYLYLLKKIKSNINNLNWDLSALAESDPQSNDYFINSLFYVNTIKTIEKYKNLDEEFLIIFEDSLLGLALEKYLIKEKFKYKVYNQKLRNKIIFYIWLIYGFLKTNFFFIVSFLYKKFSLKKINLKDINNSNIIIFHLFINKNSLLPDGSLKDNIFNDLPIYFSKKNYFVVYFLNDFLYNNSIKDFRIWLRKADNSNVKFFLIYNLINIKDIILSVIFSMKYIFFSLKKISLIFNDVDLTLLFFLFIKTQVRSKLTNYSFLYYLSLKKLAKLKIRPKIIIDIYEGHFWERALRKSKNKFLKDSKIFGIISSAFSKNSISMYSSFEDLLPDRIFCKSKYYSCILKNFGIPDEKIEVLGTFRYEKLFKVAELNKNSSISSLKIITIRKIAVILPLKFKIAEEVLIRIINLFIKNKLDYELTIFLHPFSQKNLVDFVYGMKFPENIKISNKSFYECYKNFDLAICSFTTMVFELIILGVPFIEIDRILGINLNMLDFNSNSISRAKNDIDLLNKINELDKSIYDTREIIKEFFIYFEKPKFDKLILFE